MQNPVKISRFVERTSVLYFPFVEVQKVDCAAGRKSRWQKVGLPACQFGCHRGTMEYREGGQAREG
ncbi:hypothetical protein [Microcoleus sp. Pol7_B1]|uniref:hypothetical protein n=1 Tax=Microcoleus sp. Pol7_B1 TaxID=2818894 RepID=UPI002FD43837